MALTSFVWLTLYFCQVELDVLTGEKTVRRADVIGDTGASISPMVSELKQ